MAKGFFRDARILFEEATSMFELGHFHRTVRLSQESFELLMKACLRAVGIEHPKEHDVSDALADNEERFPAWFRDKIPFLSEASSWLVEKRGPSMYGDEIKGIPASKLFGEEDAEKALKLASDALNTTEKLLRELFREEV